MPPQNLTNLEHLRFSFFFLENDLSKHNLRKLKNKLVKLTTQTLFDPEFMRLTIFLMIVSIIFIQRIIY